MRHRFLITAATAALALGACDRVGESGDAGPLSRSEYADEANEICEKSRTEAAQIAPPSLADPVAVEQAVAQTIEIQRRALRDLRALEPPARDEPGVKTWLRNVDRAIDEMEALRRGLEVGDREAIADASAEGDAFTDAAEEFADAYGLSDCSTSPPEER